jgi:rubrerythrin
MPEGRGYQRLKSQSSLEDILRVAIDFERSARDFYTDMLPRVSKNIRYLLEELATEEQQHFDLFSQLAARSDLTQMLQTAIERPASDGRFSDCIHLPDMGDRPDDQSILQYALMREHAAMEQYSALALNTPPGPVQDLFKFLANEETLHKHALEKRYYEVVHSGGV